MRESRTQDEPVPEYDVSELAIAVAGKHVDVWELEVPLERPVALAEDLCHHRIDGKHLWIGVGRGVLVSLDDDEHGILSALRSGRSPAELLATGDPLELSALTGVLTRCAEAGLLRDFVGHHDECELAPGRHARIHLTARCQLRCVHCYASSGPEAAVTGELSTPEWIRVIDAVAAAQAQTVLFTGGEPLLRDDCAALLRHAAARGLEVTLFTNGLLVEKKLPEFRGAVRLVQVSLNGPDERSNDAIRGRSTFRRAMRAIEVLVRSGTPVRIGMTVMESNWVAIRDGFREFTAGFAGADVRFHLGLGVCRHGRGAALRDGLDLEAVRREVDLLLEAANGPVGRRITRKTVSCGYCEQLVIGPDGGVYPCHLLEGRLGHVFDKPLEDWHGILRDTAARYSVDRIEGCDQCDLRHLCGGTCRVVNAQETGSAFRTTCTAHDRTARYRTLVRLFAPTKRGGLCNG